jgi:hypothetical protein
MCRKTEAAISSSDARERDDLVVRNQAPGFPRLGVAADCGGRDKCRVGLLAAGGTCLDWIRGVVSGNPLLEKGRQLSGCRGEPLWLADGHRLHMRTGRHVPPVVKRSDDEAGTGLSYRTQLIISGNLPYAHQWSIAQARPDADAIGCLPGKSSMCHSRVAYGHMLCRPLSSMFQTLLRRQRVNRDATVEKPRSRRAGYAAGCCPGSASTATQATSVGSSAP